MINEKVRYDFNDLLIQPDTFSTISSRSQVNPYDNMYFLPLMTAPMDTVVDETNQDVFYRNKIHTVLPRKKDVGEVSMVPGKWKSYSLEQFEECFLSQDQQNHAPMFALIDIANGHMSSLQDLVRRAKHKYSNSLVLMVGNVANPSTFNMLAQAGASFVRVGIGSGGACTTSANTGVGYPLASLIDECKQIKDRYMWTTRIVADGGMKNYDDIIKALGLGADKVMIGSLFNKALESCSPNHVDVGTRHYETYEKYYQWINKDSTTNPELDRKLRIRTPKTPEELMKEGKLYKLFRGMSTKGAQQAMGNTELKTSEGVSRWIKVEYNLETWVENFTDYLRSAMSYTNSETLLEFIGHVDFNVITPAARQRFFK